jgi:hypothetical protein
VSLFLFVVGMTNGPKIFSLFLMALLTISSILVFPYYMQQPEGLEPSEILIFLFSLIPLLALLYSFVLALCVVMLLVCHEEFRLFSLIPLLALLYSFVLALCVVMLLVCHEEFRHILVYWAA